MILNNACTSVRLRVHPCLMTAKIDPKLNAEPIGNGQFGESPYFRVTCTSPERESV